MPLSCGAAMLIAFAGGAGALLWRECKEGSSIGTQAGPGSWSDRGCRSFACQSSGGGVGGDLRILAEVRSELGLRG